jgi:hypothetical protein
MTCHLILHHLIVFADESRTRKVLYTLMLIPPMTINILIVLLASVTTYIYIAVMLAVGLLLVHAGVIQSALRRWFCSQQAGVAEAKDFIESKAEAKAILL